MQRGMRRWLDAHLRGRQQHLDIVLEVEKIHVSGGYAPLLFVRGTESRRRDAHGLADARHVQIAVQDAGIAQKGTADLKNPYPVELAVQVVADVGDQSAYQIRPHDRKLARDRIEQPDRLRIPREILLPAFFHEAVADDFLIAGSSHALAQVMQRSALLRQSEHARNGNRGMGRNALEPIYASHLLDQVFFDFDVEAIARRRNDKELVGATALAAGFETESREDIRHLVRGDLHADDLARPRDSHFYRLPLRQRRHGVRGRTGLTATDIEYQCRGALDSVDIVVEVDPALEAVGSIARKVVAPRPACNRIRKKERGFQKHVSGVEFGFGTVTAHDAGQPDRSARIRDGQYAFIQFHGLLIQQLQLFALAGETHVDAA